MGPGEGEASSDHKSLGQMFTCRTTPRGTEQTFPHGPPTTWGVSRESLCSPEVDSESQLPLLKALDSLQLPNKMMSGQLLVLHTWKFTNKSNKRWVEMEQCTAGHQGGEWSPPKAGRAETYFVSYCWLFLSYIFFKFSLTSCLTSCPCPSAGKSWVLHSLESLLLKHYNVMLFAGCGYSEGLKKTATLW